MTRIPDKISFIVRILSSVRKAVLILSRENIFPIHPIKQTVGNLSSVLHFKVDSLFKRSNCFINFINETLLDLVKVQKEVGRRAPGNTMVQSARKGLPY